MQVHVVLVDINPKMIKAWRETFEENPEVEIVQGFHARTTRGCVRLAHQLAGFDGWRFGCRA